MDEPETVGLSQRVGTNFEETQEQVVTIPRNAMMQYQTNATINGRSVLVMVDTGANMVAISSEQARAMNIDYSAGTPAQVETASGLTSAYAHHPAVGERWGNPGGQCAGHGRRGRLSRHHFVGHDLPATRQTAGA